MRTVLVNFSPERDRLAVTARHVQDHRAALVGFKAGEHYGAVAWNQRGAGTFQLNVVFQGVDIEVYLVFTVSRQRRCRAVSPTVNGAVAAVDACAFGPWRFDQYDGVGIAEVIVGEG